MKKVFPIITERILLAFFIMLLSVACSDASGVKGEVVDIITGIPLPNVTISANTKTKYEEDKKCESITTKTNKNGKFVLKGLCDQYKYSITATKQGYSLDEIRIPPTPEGKTTLLQKPLKIAKVPENAGVYLYSDGKLNAIQSTTLKKAEAEHYSVRPASFHYIEQSELINHIKGEGNVRILVWLPKKMGDIYPLTYFDELDYGKKKFSNIYVMGARKENNRIKQHGLKWSTWFTGSKYKQPVGPFEGYYTGQLPRHLCKLHHNDQLNIIHINYLPKGVYGLRTGEWQSREYYIFEKQ